MSKMLYGITVVLKTNAPVTSMQSGGSDYTGLNHAGLNNGSARFDSGFRYPADFRHRQRWFSSGALCRDRREDGVAGGLLLAFAVPGLPAAAHVQRYRSKRRP